MAAVAQGFKWWRKKDEEDESRVKNIIGDFAGNMLGGLPFIRDAYSFFSDGYEIENFFYASLNDLLDAFSAVRDLSSGTIKGEETDSRAVMVSLRKLLYAAGQITGIPTRNIYNLFYNTANRITPEASYKWADKFYKQSYRADLAEAIEKEDDEMISTIVGLMLNENVGNVTSESVRKEMDKLVTAGFDVIPRSVPGKITINDEEIELNKKEKTSFRTMYFTANDKAAKLVSSTQYTGASSEAQAKALQFIYNTYYAMAKGELTGTEATKNELFASAINIETLAIVIAKANALTADVDRKGNTINGSRKKKVQKYVSSLKLTAVQKYMIMGYLGYTNANGAEQVKAYINRLPISSEEKQKLYEYSGYKAG